MSRGPGQLQRQILDYLVTGEAGVTYESLRWDLFDRRRAAPGPPPGDIPTRLDNNRLPSTWNSSLKRALDGLADRSVGRVVVDRRHLSSFEELVRHYPGKTLQVDTRRLRITLLPVLEDLVRTGNQYAHYSQAGNEEFYMITHLRERANRFRKAWRNLESELFEQLPRLSGEDRSDLFLLIARARSLFESAPLECRRSIAQCVGPLVERRALPPGLQEKVIDFSDSLLPPTEIGFLQVKSFIRSFTDIPRYGSDYRLKPEILDTLEEERPDVVKALPGYEPPPPPGSRRRLPILRDEPRSTHGQLIHTLLDKTVFEKFTFISLPVT